MQNLSITQNLNQKLSPQQIQFMKLLQVSSSNIEGIIKKELEANPTLEEESNDLTTESDSNIDDFKLDQESYKTKSSFNSENKNSEIPFSVGSSLNEKLLDQLSYLKLNEKEQIIAKQIIGTIDEDGYLRRDIESIIDDIAFAENFEAEINEIENILKLIKCPFLALSATIGNIDFLIDTLSKIHNKKVHYIEYKKRLMVLDKYFKEYI